MREFVRFECIISLKVKALNSKLLSCLLITNTDTHLWSMKASSGKFNFYVDQLNHVNKFIHASKSADHESLI